MIYYPLRAFWRCCFAHLVVRNFAYLRQDGDFGGAGIVGCTGVAGGANIAGGARRHQLFSLEIGNGSKINMLS